MGITIAKCLKLLLVEHRAHPGRLVAIGGATSGPIVAPECATDHGRGRRGRLGGRARVVAVVVVKVVLVVAVVVVMVVVMIGMVMALKLRLLIMEMRLRRLLL